MDELTVKNVMREGEADGALAAYLTHRPLPEAARRALENILRGDWDGGTD